MSRASSPAENKELVTDSVVSESERITKRLNALLARRLHELTPPPESPKEKVPAKDSAEKESAVGNHFAAYDKSLAELLPRLREDILHDKEVLELLIVHSEEHYYLEIADFLLQKQQLKTFFGVESKGYHSLLSYLIRRGIDARRVYQILDREYVEKAMSAGGACAISLRDLLGTLRDYGISGDEISDLQGIGKEKHAASAAPLVESSQITASRSPEDIEKLKDEILNRHIAKINKKLITIDLGKKALQTRASSMEVLLSFSEVRQQVIRLAFKRLADSFLWWGRNEAEAEVTKAFCRVLSFMLELNVPAQGIFAALNKPATYETLLKNPYALESFFGLLYELHENEDGKGIEKDTLIKVLRSSEGSEKSFEQKLIDWWLDSLSHYQQIDNARLLVLVINAYTALICSVDESLMTDFMPGPGLPSVFEKALIEYEPNTRCDWYFSNLKSLVKGGFNPTIILELIRKIKFSQIVENFRSGFYELMIELMKGGVDPKTVWEELIVIPRLFHPDITGVCVEEQTELFGFLNAFLEQNPSRDWAKNIYDFLKASFNSFPRIYHPYRYSDYYSNYSILEKHVKQLFLLLNHLESLAIPVADIGNLVKGLRYLDSYYNERSQGLFDCINYLYTNKILGDLTKILCETLSQNYWPIACGQLKELEKASERGWSPGVSKCLNDYIKGLGGEELYQYAVQGLAKASPLSRLLDYNKLNLKSCQARLFEEISANKFNDTELLNLKKLVPLVIEQIQSLSELTQFQLAMQAQDVSTALGRFFHLVKYGSPETKVSDEAVDPAIDAILKSHLADVLELLRAIPYGDDQLSGLAFLRKAVREHIASIDGPDLKVSLCIEALNKVTMLGKFFHLNRKSWITTMGFASTSRSELSEIINILKQHMNLVWAYIQTPERTDDELASFVSLQPELLNHIRNLDGGTAKAMLSEALTAGTNLNKIFVIKRGEGLFAKNYLELVEQERQRRISPVKTEKTSKEADFGASVAEIVAAAVKAEDSETRTHGFSPEIL